MTLQEIIDFVNYVSNKEQSGNTLSTPQINTVLKAVNLDYFKLKYGLPEEYRVGAAIPRQAWEVTQLIKDTLKQFIVNKTYPNEQLQIDSNGIAPLPDDYVHVSSVRYIQHTNKTTCGNNQKIRSVEIVTDDQLNDRLSNSLKNPTLMYPIAVLYKDYIQFFPKQLGQVDFTYLRLPKTPYYDYYQDANDNIVYLAPGETSPIPPNPLSLSVEFEYPEAYHMDLCRMILGYIGINLREGSLLQYAEAKKKEGV